MKSTIKQVKRLESKGSISLKIAAILLVLTAVICIFSGCNDTVIATQSETSPDRAVISSASQQTLNIGYSADDSFNPYNVKTDLNTDLTSLVFEPLFYVDDTFCATSCLGLSYSLSGNQLTVKIDTSAAFSDGVQISSTDVVYSFNTAKQSSVYCDELAFITSVSATSTDTVVFTVSGNSRNVEDSLTFPIVKSGTASSYSSIPVGTGLYAYSKNGEEITLKYNPYCRKPQPNITAINLIALDTSSTLIHTLELGTIDAFFDDLSSGSYSQANASVAKTNLTNLVFLGMNSSSYGLSSSAVRQAIYYSINRQSIVSNSFKNYATASYTPYHPEWHIFTHSDCDTSSMALDYSKAQSLMKNAGYNDKINLTLIVYSGNNFKLSAAKEIAENLANIGINITVSELSWENYKLALANGNYDLYIGEIKLPANMDMSSLFSSSKAVCGVSSSDTTGNAYNEFIAGNISLTAFNSSFLQNMPFAPICFRMGTLFYSRSITTAADCDMGNVYKNIYEWNIN